MPTEGINKQFVSCICKLRVGHCSTPNRYICQTQQIVNLCAVLNEFILFLLFREQQSKITTDRQIPWVNLVQNPLEFANFVSLNAPLLIQLYNKIHSHFMSIERQHGIVLNLPIQSSLWLFQAYFYPLNKNNKTFYFFFKMFATCSEVSIDLHLQEQCYKF